MKIYQTKTYRVTKALENHFQIAIVKMDHHPPIEIIFAKDHQIEKFHKIIHKIDIADQTAKLISVETITQDRTQTELHNYLLAILQMFQKETRFLSQKPSILRQPFQSQKYN